MADGGEFNFNDELFLNPEDLKRLQTRFPLVAFAFYSHNASKLFARFDCKAKQEKRAFQRYGLATVALALIALLIAAADPMFVVPAVERQQLPESSAKIIALLAAIFGALAVLIGWAGMGIGARRHEWLKNRFICERIRQWQSQYVCSHAAEIAAAARTPEGPARYVAARDASFALFESEQIKNVGARLTSLLHTQHDNPPPLWIEHSFEHGTPLPTAQTPTDQAIQKQLFEAYDEIRFRAQVDYTEYMRGRGPLRSHPRTQHHVLSVVSYAAIISILVLDIAVIVGVLGGIPALKHPLVHFLAVAAALIGLALRVLEDGLQPAAHVTRLEGYLEKVSRARQRFRATAAQTEKILGMRALEEAAALEMIGFLKTGAAARYVL